MSEVPLYWHRAFGMALVSVKVHRRAMPFIGDGVKIDHK